MRTWMRKREFVDRERERERGEWNSVLVLDHLRLIAHFETTEKQQSLLKNELKPNEIRTVANCLLRLYSSPRTVRYTYIHPIRHSISAARKLNINIQVSLAASMSPETEENASRNRGKFYFIFSFLEHANLPKESSHVYGKKEGTFPRRAIRTCAQFLRQI